MATCDGMRGWRQAQLKILWHRQTYLFRRQRVADLEGRRRGPYFLQHLSSCDCKVSEASGGGMGHGVGRIAAREELVVVDTGSKPSDFLLQRASEDRRVVYRFFPEELAWG